MDDRRTARVSQALREELAELIGFELSDPRVRAADVSAVEVSQDGRHAYIKVFCRGDEKAQKQALSALAKAAGFLRHEVAARLELRHVPELHFEPEKHPDTDERIEILLKRAGKSRGRSR